MLNKKSNKCPLIYIAIQLIKNHNALIISFYKNYPKAINLFLLLEKFPEIFFKKYHGNCPGDSAIFFY